MTKTGQTLRQPLVDQHGRVHTYLRISVTDRCNFRCVYCMPEEGIDWSPNDSLLSFEEMHRLANLFASMGVTKIRLTGGEPTVRPGLENLIASLSSIDGINTILMTTNGYRLSDMADTYKKSGLNGVNISLDSLNPEKFFEITRRDSLSNVLAGINAAIEAGIESVKVNVVAMAGVNQDEILDFVEFVKDKPINVRFIEVMPFEDNGWQVSKVYPYQQMLEDINSRYTLERIDTEPNAVGKDYRIQGFQGTVGFVTSMTESFCSSCNRVRLTADGCFKPCLHSDLETNLRDPIREGATDDELEALIRSTLAQKQFEHAPMAHLARLKNRSMILIGG